VDASFARQCQRNFVSLARLKKMPGLADSRRSVRLLWRLVSWVRGLVVGFGSAELNDGYAQDG